MVIIGQGWHEAAWRVKIDGFTIDDSIPGKIYLQGMPRRYEPKDVKLLWGAAAARCAFPGCRIELILTANPADAAATIGEIAHIVAHADSGPRCDPSFPAAHRNKYENLILLCGTHHAMVDAQPNTYGCDELRRWKQQHENWVRMSLGEAMTAVTFVELELVTQQLLQSPTLADGSFAVTAPREKMRRNGLTRRVDLLLSMGLANAAVTGRFVEAFAAMDPDFPESLKSGFLAEYRRDLAAGLLGDELFESLREFACSGSRDFRRQAAGLCVLAYLFEKCEVFEP